MKKHPTKSISFLLELIIVIFFFALASSICVVIMFEAKQKSAYASDMKQVALFAQNLIEQQDSILHETQFTISDKGDVVANGEYNVQIIEKEKRTHGSLCTMNITKDGKQLIALSFYRKER